MMFMYIFVVILLIIYNCDSQTSKYCPSDNWVECAVADNECEIPSTVKAASISYGVLNTGVNPSIGSWIFAEVTNNDNSKNLKFTCEDSNFGDPYYGLVSGCCYNMLKKIMVHQQMIIIGNY